MADKIDDGGPAFPRTGEMRAGMSLRAYFAGQALTGYRWHAEHAAKDADAVARWCVQDADALLAELRKEKT